MPEKIISIFGTGKAQPPDEAWQLAEQTGQLLAQEGYTIANGGYEGTMLAAAKAADEAGGRTIGVTCSIFERTTPNPHIKRNITTGSLDERLETLINLGSAYIILPGGTGTLLEMAKVWELKNKHFMNQDKLIILIGDFWKPLAKLIEQQDPGSENSIRFVDKPEEAVKLIISTA